MNSLEKLGFKFLADTNNTYTGVREISYIKDNKIAITFKSIIDNEPFIYIIYGGALLTNDEMLEINTAINEYWNKNKDKFKRGK